MNKEFEWTEFYPQFANELLNFSQDRGSLISRLKKCYEKIGSNFPKMDYDGKVRDVDPFTVFGLFNKGISNDNRIKLLTAIRDEFGISCKVPELFNGIPVLNNMMACFFAYSNDPRLGENDIDNLWRMFEVAIDIADGNEKRRSEFVNIWDMVIRQFGVRWNLTMGLYWIRPRYFVNLDSVNREYIRKDAKLADKINTAAPKVLSGTMPTGEQYLAVCETVHQAIAAGQMNSANLPEFSYNAWKDSQGNEHGPVAEGERRKIWLCAPGHGGCAWDACKGNGFICLGWDELGDLSKYKDRDAMHERLVELRDDGARSPKNASLACWQFANELRQNDIIVAKAGLHKILGVGIVAGKYGRDDTRDEYKNIVPCKWVISEEKIYSDQLPMKTLTDISGYPEVLHAIFSAYGLDPDTLEQVEDAEPNAETNEDVGEEYSKEDFLSEVFMSSDEYERIRRLLEVKKNIVFQGAPGVGKTFAAKRFAASLVGYKDSAKIKLVQFHQNYTYEDFIGGYKPSGAGFEYRTGVFYDFCQQAKIDTQGRYYFIIDEINRGNLSKIFGELLMLIEADKRNEDVRLAYTGESFFVPENVYIIGMMNTADRSLAMIDYALRRRFSFVPMRPQLDNEKFKAVIAENHDPKIVDLVTCVSKLNEAIRNDAGLGEGFEIGHSYFCGKLAATDIVEFELKPLLREYWYDNLEKVDEWSRKLEDVLK